MKSVSVPQLSRLQPSCRRALNDLLVSTAGDNTAEMEQQARVPLYDLRSEPGKASLETLREELAKLEVLQFMGLPSELVRELPPRTLRDWRQQVAVEELYELRRHPDTTRIALLTAYCLVRRQELTDNAGRHSARHGSSHRFPRRGTR